MAVPQVPVSVSPATPWSPDTQRMVVRALQLRSRTVVMRRRADEIARRARGKKKPRALYHMRRDAAAAEGNVRN